MPVILSANNVYLAHGVTFSPGPRIAATGVSSTDGLLADGWVALSTHVTNASGAGKTAPTLLVNIPWQRHSFESGSNESDNVRTTVAV